MSVTITGGISFSGGVGIVAAPPAGPTAGWVGGGMNSSSAATSSVDRITYATDTATATVRGPLSSATYTQASAGTFTQGWFGGGYTFPFGPPYRISTVQRITYATDTATASVRGPLNTPVNYLGATSDQTTYGWFVGGLTPGIVSTVQRITYSTDTTATSVRGPLSYEQARIGATGNTTDGWFAGGAGGAGGNPNSGVQRITYATDTATASARGPLAVIVRMSAGAGTSTQGWIAGKNDEATNTNVQRITYATDTATASVRGPLSVDVFQMSASTDDTTYGWFAGGSTPRTSTVQRITYATDTVTASVMGPLNLAKNSTSATSGQQ
jgi:hypothetical protein